ncbi:MAG: hypothetical protein GAK45_01660 [Pseudomonas citronellolis]|nr:MAG: hypothetical protein GAK45_01660 [Pseudomonas citronellolis]
MNREQAQRRWQHEALAYAERINAYVAKGQAEGWDNAGEAPSNGDFEGLLPHLREALREANAQRPRQDIKADWPPSHIGLGELPQEQGQAIPTVCWLPDGSLLARIGAPYLPGKVVRIHGDEVSEVDGVEHFGRCPQRRYFAKATAEGVRVHDGWDGPQTAFCPWPKGTEGIPEGFTVAPLEHPPTPTRLIPFPDGRRVLLASSDGIFVLGESAAQRLLPDPQALRDEFGYARADQPDEEQAVGISMEHVALSADGRLIAAGHQCSQHAVFDEHLQAIADIGPHGEYPHFALFSADGRTLALNACHFYNGATLAVQVDRIPGLRSEFYQEDVDGQQVVEEGARVYAGIGVADTFILGDAYGYLRTVGLDGDLRWQHYIGSTLCDMDLSDDGRTLAVSTFAGYISLIELDAGRRQPYQIGTGEHFETRRWLFWKDEAQALAW